MESRKLWTVDELADGIVDLHAQIKERLDKKGYLSFIGRHEILGIITEEYKEVIDAVHNKVSEGDSVQAEAIYKDRDKKHLSHELLDLAVAAILGYVSVKHDKIG